MKSTQASKFNWNPAQSWKRLTHFALDFAEQEAFATGWTLAFTSLVSAYLMTRYGEAAAEMTVIYIFMNLLSLVIFLFFPKNETEETVKEVYELLDELHTAIMEKEENNPFILTAEESEQVMVERLAK